MVEKDLQNAEKLLKENKQHLKHLIEEIIKRKAGKNKDQENQNEKNLISTPHNNLNNRIILDFLLK